MSEELVKKAARGDRTAFGALAKELEDSAYYISKSLLRSEQDCLDAFQEAACKAFLSIRKLKDPKLFRTWFIRILINECRNLERKGRISAAEPLETEPQNPESRDFEMEEALASLEHELRAPILLFYFEGWTTKEIGLALNVPEGTVKSRLIRARKKLAEFFGVERGDEE